MLFAWKFNEGEPAPGNAQQPPITDAEGLNRRRLFARVLSEPPVISRGYTAGPVGGGGGAAHGSTGDDNVPSEGFTSLLSNGDELLRLCEHCRVVIDNVVDAPPSLLATGNIGNAAITWHTTISWFQVRA